MVATELMKRAETEEELKEVRQEKEALSRALCVIKVAFSWKYFFRVST